MKPVFKFFLFCALLTGLYVNSDVVSGKVKMELWPFEPCSNIEGSCIEL